MSLESELEQSVSNIIGGDDGATEKQRKDRQGPFLQFEPCKIKDCNMYNENGTCIAETCIYKNEIAGLVPIATYTCKICNQHYTRNPQYNDIQICDTCLKRLQSIEAPPVKCFHCGTTIQKRPRVPYLPLCDTCLRKLNAAIDKA